MKHIKLVTKFVLSISFCIGLSSTLAFADEALVNVRSNCPPAEEAKPVDKIKIQSDSAIIEWTPENSKKFYMFFEKNIDKFLKDFWIEKAQTVDISDVHVCKMKTVKKFGQEVDGEPLFVCYKEGLKYFGPNAETDFNKNKDSNLTKITTIHGQNLGCTKFEYSKAPLEKYQCGMIIFDNGTTETNAPWIPM